MKNSLISIPILLLSIMFCFFLSSCSSNGVQISESMKEKYNKKKNMNQGCNSQTADFINEISLPGNYEYGKDKSPINYYEYYCVLKDGTIVNFYKSKSEEFDSKEKFIKGSLYEKKLFDGKRFEYSIEKSNLIEYSCRGTTECIGDIQRKILGKKISIKN